MALEKNILLVYNISGKIFSLSIISQDLYLRLIKILKPFSDILKIKRYSYYTHDNILWFIYKDYWENIFKLLNLSISIYDTFCKKWSIVSNFFFNFKRYVLVWIGIFPSASDPQCRCGWMR